MKILIKNGTILTSSDIFQADLLIEDSVISGISSKINQTADETIDAAGKLVIPGGIDVHTHFQLPVKGTVSADSFESGSRAAACGGITTFIDFAHQVKGESILKTFENRIKEAENEVFIDYSLHVGFAGVDDKLLKSIPKLIEQGVPSFKLYMVYAKEGWMSDDASLYAMLQATREYGGIIIVHAENPFLIDYFTEKLQQSGRVDIPWLRHSRPDFTESEAIKRALYLTEITGSRIYIVHVSTGEGVTMLSGARGKGIAAFAETCPQYLLLNDGIYNREDGYLFTTNPPLRKINDQLALWKGLSMGIIQVISTDHCSFTREQKQVGKGDFTKTPNGLPGIETMVSLIYSEGVLTGRITPNQWVEYISTNPAKMFGLYPRKGTISPGADADVVVFDPQKTVKLKPEILHYKVDYSPYSGLSTQGWPEITISRGKIIYRYGEFSGEKGWGKFVPRFYASSNVFRR